MRTTFQVVLVWPIAGLLTFAGTTRAGAAAAPSAEGKPAAAAPAAPVVPAGFTAAADYSTKYAGRAVLIMHKGQVVFERYDNGWSAEKPHPLASGTKSFTGVMAMMAVQDGLLTLDELVSDTITEWKSDARKSKITVRHLLTLSSGLDGSDALLGGRGGSALLGEGAKKRADRLSRQPGGDQPAPANLAKAALDVPMNHEAGERFEYGPSHFYAFCELLNRKLAAGKQPQKSTMAYLSERVFRAVGIDVARIGRDRAGNPNLPGGAVLTAREWSKFGQFVLQGGSVPGPEGKMTNLLRPELLAECFKPSKANPSYGLTWWLLTDSTAGAEADTGGGGGGGAGGGEGAKPGDRLRERLRERMREKSFEAEVAAVKGPDGKPLRVYMAAGLGKQRLYVLPDYDLVVVRFAESKTEGMRFDNAAFLKPILEELGAKVPAAAGSR